MEKRSIAFIPQIDGLRFIAVFGVMISHWASNYANSYILFNIPYGTGVNLFFVISGFLITYILLNKKDDITEGVSSIGHELKNFYAKRTLRIFPIYYLLILILCIFTFAEIKEYLLYLLTYTINWFMVFKGVYISNKTHLWSLAVEEQFYLIWPFLLFFTKKRAIPFLIIFSILLGMASKIYFMYYTPYWMGVNGATTSCFDALGLGAAIGYLQKNRTTPFNARPYKTGLAAVLIAYILFFVNPGILSEDLKKLLFNFGTSFVYFFLVILAANSSFTGGFGSFLENKAVLYLGRISYGLYLYHCFAPNLYYIWFARFFSDQADVFVICFFITLVMATLSWYLIERPLLNLKKYFNK